MGERGKGGRELKSEVGRKLRQREREGQGCGNQQAHLSSLLFQKSHQALPINPGSARSFIQPIKIIHDADILYFYKCVYFLEYKTCLNLIITVYTII